MKKEIISLEEIRKELSYGVLAARKTNMTQKVASNGGDLFLCKHNEAYIESKKHQLNKDTVWEPTPKPAKKKLALATKYGRKLHKLYKNKPYSLFLESQYWQDVRFEIIKRDAYRCTQCRSYWDLQVHHYTYEHHYEEHLHHEDLITLCRTCHKKLHKEKGTPQWLG